MAANPHAKSEYQLLHRRNSQGPVDGSADLETIRHENTLDPVPSDDATESDLDLEEYELKRVDSEPIGAAKIESITAVWTPATKQLFVIGQAIFVVMFSFASTTTHSYVSYALSDFKSLSKQGSLDVTSQIISMSLKLPVAKLSDVLGRAEAYCILTIFDMLSEIIRAAAPTFTIFGVGWMFYVAGHGGFSVLNMILISDVTSMRIRALAGSALYSPFLVTPWISGQLVDKVVDKEGGGIGWRWGYGMFTIIIPLGAAPLIGVLFYLQRKAVRKGLAVTKRMTFKDFCEQTDLVGLILLCGGFAMVLLPVTRLSSTDGGGSWRAPWVIALIATGTCMIIWFVGHERYHAKHPVVPLRYFRQTGIVFTWLLSMFDSVAFAATHTYLFPWSVAAHNYTAKKALYLTYTNGVTTCLVGLLAGVVMYRMRSYKRMAIIASIIRLIGYALMTRLRTKDSSDFELFLVQMIQGIGTGIIEVTGFVAAQIVVPHSELAQVTALSSLGSHLGDAIGAAIAGGVYTSRMKGRLRAHLGPAVSIEEIAGIYDSILGHELPDWGTAKRVAVADAYSDIMGYVTIIGLVVSVPIIAFAFLIPDNRLGDGKNLVGESKSEDLDSVPMRRAKVTR
ncbi:Siderophore iron transporter 3 [Pseudocercospora fuligena]|uniref:Siderophore iron transporter 3 n=1 Tax=Pseudocercospora fuligena TaxID=685502 RepID=A0A8H6RQT8_9PEZI|nr:Siderophore iron transporter 3 [Pseudocercospora fuligena]